MSPPLTPMFQQYQELKARYPDALLLFRLGDFYELFGEDAEVASRDLDITLTSREAAKGQRIPMCGIPHHALESYLAQLVAKGHKVAVCDQLEDPRQAKGVVHRDVTRVVTPGTLLDPAALPARRNNFLLALTRGREGFGLAALDLSTGEFTCTQLTGAEARERLEEELVRLHPAEVLLGPGVDRDEGLAAVLGDLQAAVRTGQERPFTPQAARHFLLTQLEVGSLEAFGCEGLPLAQQAAAAALRYAAEAQRTALSQVTALTTYSPDRHMVLDAATRRNLELTRTLRDGSPRGSLLSTLDATVTAPGARLLRRWVEQPLREVAAIGERLDAVEELAADELGRAELRNLLGGVHDLERLVGRVAYQSATARDLVAVAASLSRLPELRRCLARARSALLRRLGEGLDPCPDVAAAIEAALVPDPPAQVREGGLIRPGYDPEVDRLRRATGEGKEWIARLEAQERERTGIKSLKVGFNKVFGYYIEVTRPNLHAVPPEYERRQTLAGAERFVTPALKAREADVLGAEERAVEREYELFLALRQATCAQAGRIQQAARIVAQVDALAALAETAVRRGYCRPAVDEGDRIEIRQGRHPVVESMLQERGFVPNDTLLDTREHQLLILTGPNMAGKSTYLRQVALIVLLAQVGSFVPAESARIGVADRIFTRVGASDELASGRSTFMVEMSEAAHILHHASPRSLVLLDELGRGTSTYDGMALAQAIAEHLHDQVGARTILSTHYHELTALEGTLARARNLRTEVQESRGRVAFLYRVVPGAADRSYGLNVARMAGIPRPVLLRAQRLLHELEQHGRARGRQLSFLDLAAAAAGGDPPALDPQGLVEDEILEALRRVDVNVLTPLEALARLAEWQRRLKEG